MNLQNLRTGPRQALGFGLVIALMALIVGITTVMLQNIDANTHHVQELQQRYEHANQWRGLVTLNNTRAIAVAQSQGNAELATKLQADSVDTSAQISKLQEKLTAEVTSEQGKALLAAVAVQRASFKPMRDAVFKSAQTHPGKESDAQTLQRLVTADKAYQQAISAIADYQKDLVATVTTATKDSIRQAQVASLALLSVGVLCAIGIGLLITRSITRPLNRTVEAVSAMAAGDLTQRIHIDGKDEMAQMLQSLATMQQALRHLIGEVRSGSDSMSTASEQIASGNQDLSSRTEQTAGSLQQAASSLEQLTGTVGQTADSARTANQLAASASTVAQRGGQVVAQVVQTMEEINTSSKRIADIIGTIDGIAFQTNILALNAAVEAARAGEQGRGFAVVASEVRSLAQRSADAAREIKSLISTSVEKVAVGSRLVTDAGDTMGEIVSSVQRVTDIIGEISAATAEQSTGLSQVNSAVAGLDQMTQQNAALVEESAAAAESLRDQSRQLATLVGSFRTAAGDSSSGPVPLAAKTTGAKPASPARAATAAGTKPSKRPPAVAGGAHEPATAARDAINRARQNAPSKAVAGAGADDWESF